MCSVAHCSCASPFATHSLHLYVFAQEDGVFKTVLSNVHDGNANHDLEFNFLRGIALPSATERN